MKRIYILIFIILFIGIGLIYNYQKILFLDPQSQHQWRQTDCVSLAMNYYHNGLNFFKPQMHNVLGGEGQAVGEFPILYYITAIVYTIFGPDEIYFRLINLSIFLAGLLALFKLTYRLTKDLLLSFVISLFFFASPVMVFYANNFLPDVPAFSIALIAWYYFFHFYDEPKLKWLYISMGLFLVAGLLKITALISFIAILAIYVFEFDNWHAFGKNRKIFIDRWKALLPLALVVIINTAWYIFAAYYNKINNAGWAFSTQAWPLWDLDPTTVVFALYRTFFFWSKDYFHPATLYIIIFLTFYVLFRYKKEPSLLYAVSLITFIGVLLFYQLWGFAFIDHDYYIINLNIYVVFIFLISAIIIQTDFPIVAKSWIFKTLCVALLVLNIHHSNKMVHRRYKTDSSYMTDVNRDFYDNGLKNYLTEKGIQYPVKVISIPDKSPNITLYLLNLKGWTQFNRPINKETIPELKKEGAEYLIISDTSYLKKEGLKKFYQQPVGNFKSIYIFKL